MSLIVLFVCVMRWCKRIQHFTRYCGVDDNSTGFSSRIRRRCRWTGLVLLETPETDTEKGKRFAFVMSYRIISGFLVSCAMDRPLLFFLSKFCLLYYCICVRHPFNGVFLVYNKEDYQVVLCLCAKTIVCLRIRFCVFSCLLGSQGRF